MSALECQLEHCFHYFGTYWPVIQLLQVGLMQCNINTQARWILRQVYVPICIIWHYYISISSWSFSHIHSNKQKLLRRRTTWKHRYQVFLLPLPFCLFYLFHLRMLTNFWCMSICRWLQLKPAQNNRTFWEGGWQRSTICLCLVLPERRSSYACCEYDCRIILADFVLLCKD